METEEESTLEKERLFNDLNRKEREALRKEYDAVRPEFLKAEELNEKLKRIYKILLIATIVNMFAVLAPGIVFTLDDTNRLAFLFAIILFLTFAALFIAMYVYYFKIKNSEKSKLAEMKKFSAWLLNEKGLTVRYILTDKERAVYNSL